MQFFAGATILLASMSCSTMTMMLCTTRYTLSQSI
jgi:hypothetical protein